MALLREIPPDGPRTISANATATGNEHEKGKKLVRRSRKPRTTNPKKQHQQHDNELRRQYVSPVMDESVFPSLAVRSTSTQHIPIFIDYLMVAWPCLFKCTEKSTQISWLAYAVSRGAGEDGNAFDLGLRSMTCSFMGASGHDQTLINAGRQLYGKSLRCLASNLSKLQYAPAKRGRPNQVDEAVLAGAVLLSVYEMHHGASAEAWLYHHAGIIEMMRLRGAESHTITGFGGAIYIAYRGFFITASLLKGEACLLEQREWQAMSERIEAENARRPDSSVFTEIAERAFREMVKLPGMLKRVKDLWEMPPVNQFLVRPQLKQELAMLRAALRGLHAELGITVATHGGPDNPAATASSAGQKKRDMFVGPVSYKFFDGFSALAIRGIRSGIVLVDYLLLLLTPEMNVRDMLHEEIQTLSRDDGLTTHSPVSNEARPSPFFMMDTSQRPFPLRIESMMDPRARQGPNTAWTDRIATSYGMLGVRIHLT